MVYTKMISILTLAIISGIYVKNANAGQYKIIYKYTCRHNVFNCKSSSIVTS